MPKYKFVHNENPGLEAGATTLGHNWHANDGEVVEMPKHVAEYLNDNCSYPVKNWEVDPVTKQLVTVDAGRKQRFTFIPAPEKKSRKAQSPAGPSPDN